MYESYNHAIISNTWPNLLKVVDVTQVYRKGNKMLNQTIGQLVL